MAQKPEQPDLFDWQPKERNLFRDWQILKSIYFWIIVGLLVVFFVVWINFDSIRDLNNDANARSFFSHYWLIIFGILAMPLTFLAIWLIPKWQVRTLKDKKCGADQSDFDVEKESIRLRDDTRKTMAQIIGGAFFVLGLFVTYNTFDLNRQGQELNRQGQELSREGQVAERFSKAVALLKENDVAVRLGGLYALASVAKDSPKDHHTTVMEILAAYIREKSHEQLEKEKPAGNKKNKSDKKSQASQINNNNGASVNVYGNNSSRSNNGQAGKKIVLLTPPSDVLAAIDIIKHRNPKNDDGGFVFNLSEANLMGVNLLGANLVGANLSGANLKSAILNGVNLTNAKLINTILADAELSNADLSNAKLDCANLRNAHLIKAILIGADFSRADLTEADLINADLSRAHFPNTDLIHAELMNAKLNGADFSNANLSSANLSYADFNLANFSSTLLSNTNLINSNSEFALNFGQLSDAVIDVKTKLPNNELELRRAELTELSKDNLKKYRNNLTFKPCQEIASNSP